MTEPVFEIATYISLILLLGALILVFIKRTEWRKIRLIHIVLLLTIGVWAISNLMLFFRPIYFIGTSTRIMKGRAPMVKVRYFVNGKSNHTTISLVKFKIGDQLYVRTNKLIPFLGIVDLTKTEEELRK